MKFIKSFEIRNLSAKITRVSFSDRIVDYWHPTIAGLDREIKHVIVAHDGQNIFDPSTATRRKTWKLAETATKLFRDYGLTPPLIIAVFHSANQQNLWGRSLDLVPQHPFQSGLVLKPKKYSEVKLADLQGDYYLQNIVSKIVPNICEAVGVQNKASNTAILGSSLGGLAALYGMGKHPDFFGAALAFSPHWVLGEEPLVREIINELPSPGDHKIWLSRGTKGLEDEYRPFQNSANAQLIALGWNLEQNLKSQVFNGDRHSESSWRKQVKAALKFWLS